MAKFDQCTKKQLKLAGQAIGLGLKASFGENAQMINKSDVMTNLKDISSRVKKSTAQHKRVLVVSDMLENSALTSFYAKQAVRQINPEKELANAKQQEALGDFAGARLYVFGAGLLAEGDQPAKNTYRSPQIMAALNKFWQGWFKASNAELIEFGQPALLNPIQ